VFGSEFVLSKPSYVPIRTFSQFEDPTSEFPFKDPISAVLEVMSSLKSGENLWLQILITPTDDSWKSEGERTMLKMLGKTPKGPAPLIPISGLMEWPKLF